MAFKREEAADFPDDEEVDQYIYMRLVRLYVFTWSSFVNLYSHRVSLRYCLVTGERFDITRYLYPKRTF